MFIISITYTCNIKEIELYLDEHIKYLDYQYDAGKFLASGRKNPRTGGIILALASSRDEIEKVLADDPFKINNLATYEITEFIPSKTSPELSLLLNTA